MEGVMMSVVERPTVTGVVGVDGGTVTVLQEPRLDPDLVTTLPLPVVEGNDKCGQRFT